MEHSKQHIATAATVSPASIDVRSQSVSTITSSPLHSAVNPGTIAQLPVKHWYTLLLSPLWLCLLVALVIRVWLIVRTHGILDGDEALVGIQAEHILLGEHPVYFYGIPYFGSLEAYVAALFFAIFGPSVAALRAEATAFSLLLVSLTWRLASLLARAAQLPRNAKRCFIIVATLVAAIPPLYDGIVELRTWGGWIESLAIMLLLLVSVVRLTSRWHNGCSKHELALRWAGVGFIVGFGMWVYPLVSVAILTSALWISVDRLLEIMRRLKASEPLQAAVVGSLKGLLLAVAALPACVLGFTPGIIWGATHQWENITYLFALGGGWTSHRLGIAGQVTNKYAVCVAPRVISGTTPRESSLLTTIHSPLLSISMLCIFFTFALLLSAFIWHHPLLLYARHLAALPALFGTCSAFLFCTSSASASILSSCNDDFSGRYATPLVLALPFFFATTFTLAAMLIFKKRPMKQSEEAFLAHVNYVQHIQRTSRLRAAMVAALIAFLLLYLGGQATTYLLSNPALAFQSPYCTMAPANYAPIINYMKQEHIHYAWATNLLGYQISFSTNNTIIMADPLPLIHPKIAINRIPSYTAAIAKTDRPSFLVFVRHNDPHPQLLKLLDTKHVTYRAAFFSSAPGVDVMVVTPLSRSVSPFESKGFDIFFCSTS